MMSDDERWDVAKESKLHKPPNCLQVSRRLMLLVCHAFRGTRIVWLCGERPRLSGRRCDPIVLSREAAFAEPEICRTGVKKKIRIS